MKSKLQHPRKFSPFQTALSLSALRSTCQRLCREVNQLEAEICEAILPRWPSSPNLTGIFASARRWQRYARCLMLPTIEQAVMSVRRSAEAHSYYKHLNIGRSAEFGFNLSLVAGMRRTHPLPQRSTR